MRERNVLLGLFLATTSALAAQAGDDIRASQRYSIGQSSIELLGVCRVSETEVRCWGPKREPAPVLEEQLRATFINQTHQTVPVRYGEKARIALFRFTNPTTSGQEPYIEQSFRGGGHFSWPSAMRSDDNRVRVAATVIRAGLKDTVGEAVTSIRRTEPPSDRIPVNAGSSVRYLGTTYTIRQIIENKVEPTSTLSPTVTPWVIAMTAVGGAETRMNVNWVAIDDNGLAIRAVDSSGSPVYVDPNTLMMGRSFDQGPPQFTPVRLTAGGRMSPQHGDDYLLYTNINPEKIQFIYAHGSSTERLVITDIPLEPGR
jgi:hypothetical protein